MARQPPLAEATFTGAGTDEPPIASVKELAPVESPAVGRLLYHHHQKISKGGLTHRPQEVGKLTLSLA
jgi:hypothetical protein